MKQSDFEQQQKEYMEKLMGCNKNRSQEIDLYDKPYSEKIERVRTMYKHATSAFEEYSEMDDVDL